MYVSIDKKLGKSFNCLYSNISDSKKLTDGTISILSEVLNIKSFVDHIAPTKVKDIVG